MVEIRKTYRTVQRVHTTFFPPCYNGIQQRTTYFKIINEVEPSKADMFVIPLLIGLMIDDTGDTSHGFAVTESHP